jgi:tetratricopeptide (TPR) repeat protein
MMIEQHYDEEVLAGFLAEPIDSAARDRHLAGCSLCKQTLNSIRDTAGLLKQPDVWSRESFSSAPRPETLAFLRNVQRTMTDEDAAAEGYVKQLLAGSRETWAARLDEHPEWRTAGVVRKLIAATDRAIDVMPSDALDMTRIAVDISEHLSGASRNDAVSRLRGNSWYEHAYALMYTGAYVDALAALATAESEFKRVVVADHEIGRVNVVRAMLYRALERLDDALPVLVDAASVFRDFGDRERYYAARLAEGITLYSARRFSDAIRIHLEIAGQETIAPRWRASALQNAAICHRELGDIDAAIHCFTQSIMAFEAAGMMSFRAKARWTLARIFLAQQQYQVALSMFSELRVEFEELGMANEVALIALDVADTLLATGKTAGIAEACREAIVYFERTHLTSSAPALTALTHLREAALAGAATSIVVSGLRMAFLAETKRTQSGLQAYDFS